MLRFFEILFPGVDSFVHLKFFPTKICLFATKHTFFAIILMSLSEFSLIRFSCSLGIKVYIIKGNVQFV